ncbi:MAG TPA: hypothetical protein PK816_09205, partial [Candidatus Cloacimonadota bacterium]|nr:hypothetical protein [Candidatus Cloacimonadota bacterium]
MKNRDLGRNMRAFFLLLIIFCMIQCLTALDREDIIGSKDYYYGENTGSNYQQVRDYAIKNLADKLVVYVKSTMNSKISENAGKADEQIESVIQTYSIGTFKNLQEIKSAQGGKLNVFVYIKKSDVEALFNERKQLIADIYAQAVKMEASNNIGNALKYYYFMMILMNSLPDERVEYKGLAYHTLVPARIQNLLQNIDYKIISSEQVSDKQKDLVFQVSYQNKPVVSSRFTFWDGANQILVEAKDGKAVLSLIGSAVKMNKLDFATDYEYYDCRKEFKAVADLWDIVSKPEFSNKVSVPLTKSVMKEAQKEPTPVNLNSGKCPPEVAQKIHSETERVIRLLNINSVSEINKTFEKDEYLKKTISNLMKYNRLRVQKNKGAYDINKTYDGWEVRPVPVSLTYPTLHKQSTDYLVLNFDENGQFTDISLTLFDGIYQEYQKSSSSEEEWKCNQVMIKFLEKYRTAYLCRDMETIETLFSDDAVIIVGRMLKKIPSNKEINFTQFDKQPDIQYLKYTKSQYLENLNRSFTGTS